MRTALYLRVSTPHQALTQTIDQQLERLQAHCAAKGWPILDHDVFRDDGLSGAQLNRPGLDRLRDRVRFGELDHVLVTAPDRLARNYVHQVLLLEEFERYGCAVEFLERPMSRDPHDQLLLQIRGAVAEYERTLISDRMRRGRLMKYRAGLLLPWSQAPYGYRLDPQRPRDPAGVRIDEAEAAVVREIFDAYLGDVASIRAVCLRVQALGVPTPTGKARWNKTTIRCILTNPTYTGHVFACRTQTRPPRRRRSPTLAVAQ